MLKCDEGSRDIQEETERILRKATGSFASAQEKEASAPNTYPGTLAPLPVAPFLYVICKVAAADFLPALST